MRGIVKVYVVWTVGLAVLLGSTGVGLALSKFQQGKTYCQCACRSATSTADLTWEKVASCNINGKRCSFNDPRAPGNPLTPGKLDSCMSCQADKEGGLLCSSESSSGLRTPIPQQKLMDTIRPRSIEGELQEEKAAEPK